MVVHNVKAYVLIAGKLLHMLHSIRYILSYTNSFLSSEEFKQTLRENEVVIVDFYDISNGSSKEIAPVFAQYDTLCQQEEQIINSICSCSELDKFAKIKFLKVDVTEVSDLAAELGVKSVPSFQLYKNSEKVSEAHGADEPKLLKLLEAGV